MICLLYFLCLLTANKECWFWPQLKMTTAAVWAVGKAEQGSWICRIFGICRLFGGISYFWKYVFILTRIEDVNTQRIATAVRLVGKAEPGSWQHSFVVAAFDILFTPICSCWSWWMVKTIHSAKVILTLIWLWKQTVQILSVTSSQISLVRSSYPVVSQPYRVCHSQWREP